MLLHALVTKITDTQVELDRSTPEMGAAIPYDMLVMATGSQLPQPGTLPTSEKTASVQWLKDYQKKDTKCVQYRNCWRRRCWSS